MKPYMPRKKSRDPQNSQSQASQNSQASERPPTIDEVDKRLAELGLLTRTSEYQSQLEREADELELKRQSLLRAAEKVYRLFRWRSARSLRCFAAVCKLQREAQLRNPGRCSRRVDQGSAQMLWT